MTRGLATAALLLLGAAPCLEAQTTGIVRGHVTDALNGAPVPGAEVVVGDGPLRAEVEAQIAALNLTDRFHLTGLQRDVPDLMHSFDLFALSSLWEGLPRVLPQAMAAGLPVVSTAADGSAEAVADTVNGYLTPPGDTKAMAVALLRLLDDPALAAKMGQAGQARADEFGARKMVDDIAALYETLLADVSHNDK